MPRLRFKVHTILQMEERRLTVEDIKQALANGEDIEARPDEQPYPARLVLGWCPDGALHVAVRDNIDEDEVVIETAYRPDPAL
jgi:hypothetical protein